MKKLMLVVAALLISTAAMASNPLRNFHGTWCGGNVDVDVPQKKIWFSEKADMMFDRDPRVTDEMRAACNMASFDRKTGYFTWSCVVPPHEPEDKATRFKLKERLVFAMNPGRTQETMLVRIRDGEVEAFVPCND
jgi:hypothetical protein